MPELQNREELEAALARKLGKAGRDVLNEILDTLGDPPDINKLTEDEWRSIQARYEAVVIGQLEGIFMAAAEQTMSSVGVGVEWGLINERAATWATQYGFDLVRDMTAKRRQFLQRSVSDFFRTGMTIGDLRARLEQDYGVVRAAMIAETETTRAAVEGSRGYIRELERQGVRFRHEVRVNADDRVCPICSPKEGKDPENVGYPPYHIRCRCWYESVPIIEGVSS